MAIMPQSDKGIIDMIVNVNGVYHIQKWIDDNQDKNMQVFDLWANGIASVINRSGLIEQEITDNGHYSYETGLRDGRGNMMFINLYPEHFDR